MFIVYSIVHLWDMDDFFDPSPTAHQTLSKGQRSMASTADLRTVWFSGIGAKLYSCEAEFAVEFVESGHRVLTLI